MKAAVITPPHAAIRRPGSAAEPSAPTFVADRAAALHDVTQPTAFHIWERMDRDLDRISNLADVLQLDGELANGPNEIATVIYEVAIEAREFCNACIRPQAPSSSEIESRSDTSSISDEIPASTAGDDALDRQHVALEACHEIESLSSLLLNVARSDDVVDEHAVRGLARRIRDLNSIIMSVHGGDDRRETAEMEYEVFGRYPQQQEGVADHG